MIRINKGSPPPYLKKASGPATNRLKKQWSSGNNPTANKNIYGHEHVRNALAQAQHGKCCYCEVKIPIPYAYQHVEHFRPKSRSRQHKTAAPDVPGYYWLAYEWSNLLIACSHCNSSYKGDLFPLANPKMRALDFTDDLTKEKPLLIDPSGAEDPADHIGFHEEIPKGLTKKGRTTVLVIGLDCKAREDRLEYLNYLRKLYREVVALRKIPSMPETESIIRDKLAELILARRPEAPYSAMADAFYRNVLGP